MNNVLNSRMKKLIKRELFDYGKFLFVFLILIISTIIFFGMGIGNETTAEIISNITVSGFLPQGFFNFVFLTSGITTGAELPQYVRRGFARGEYFFAATTAMLIVVLLISPVMLLFNMIVNLVVGSQSSLYNSFLIGNGNVFNLLIHTLIYIVAFLLGIFVTTFWQRVGWKIASTILVSFLLISNFTFLNVLNILDFLSMLDVNYDDYGLDIFWPANQVADRLFSIPTAAITIGLIVALGVGTYALIKSVAVKVR